MIRKNQKTKEELLTDIEALLKYSKNQKDAIDPKLLTYLEIETLISIKKSLLSRIGVLSDEDREWLEQFKRYE